MKISSKIKDKLSVISLVFEKINNRIDRQQRRISDWLNKKCERCSPRQLTIGLVIFCFVFGCSIFFTIWNSLESYGAKRASMHITIPKHVLIKDSTGKAFHEQIFLLKIGRQLDSLQKTENGAQALDSLKKLRPGLLDSLKVMQQIYQSKNSEHEK